MVEVVNVPISIEQLSDDLRSAVVWSSIGLVSFRDFKKNVFKEFDSRELEFNLTYEKVTPFANPEVEIEYINEVQFVGLEEEFNLEEFDLFSDDSELPDDELSLDSLVVEESVVEATIRGLTSDGFDSYGVELEEDYVEPVSPMPTEVVSDDMVISEEGEKPKEGLDLSSDGALVSPLKQVDFEVKEVPASVTVLEENKPPRGIVYHEGMNLRQFLRENPRSTMDVVENYFSKKEIMKEIQLGKVIKRGQKLFI